MDVLKPARRARWTWIALGVWAFAAACLSWPGHWLAERRAEPSFPHRVHVVDNKLQCGFCHGGALVAERPGMPPPELCAPCHDKFDAEKPAERRVGAFFDARSRYVTVASSGLNDDVMFSHGRHTSGARFACEECHADVAEQDQVPLAPIASKPMCMDCHARYDASNDCSTCHRTMNRSVQPSSHERDWVRLHGEIVLAGSDRSEDSCSLCHQDSQSCLGCHQQVAPRDHDNTFRVRTHGLRASLDRSRCATCHTKDSCQQCHETTRPRSHRGGFGAPRDGHCGSCHFPLADNDCAVCHPSMPSHDLAAALPANHLPSMNCRLCHGNGVILPHPDFGHVCTTCHR